MADTALPQEMATSPQGETAHSPRQEQGPPSPKKPVASKTGASPKKPVSSRNGATTPSQAASAEQKKLPPIKAPVGQAPGPNVRNVRSKIGSLENIKHKPKGGEKKVSTVKLEWQAQSKIGSLEYATHKPGGGDKKIQTQKLDFKEKVQSKIGSKENIKHKPKGGNVKIETRKLDFKDKASSKVGSLDNVKHQAGGGNVKIKSEKLSFRERASPKVGSLSGSEKGSTHGSETQSPVPPISPPPGDAMPPVLENGEEPDSGGATSDALAQEGPVENDVGESTPSADDSKQITDRTPDGVSPSEDVDQTIEEHQEAAQC